MVTIRTVKSSLGTLAVAVFVVALMENWLHMGITVEQLAISNWNSGLFMAAYIMLAGYFVTRLAATYLTPLLRDSY